MALDQEQTPPVEAPIFEKLKQLVTEIWHVEELCQDRQGQPRPYPLYSLVGPLAEPEEARQGQEWLSQTLAELQDVVGGNLVELSRQCALLYFRPFAWLEPYLYDYNRPEAERFQRVAQGDIMQVVLFEWLKLHPTNVARSLLTERVETLLAGPGAKWKPDLYRPTLLDCVDLLLADYDDEADRIITQLTVGEYGLAKKGSVAELELRKRAPDIYRRLWENKHFDYPLFRQSMFSLPGAFHDLSRPLEKNPVFYRKLPVRFSLRLQSYVHKLAIELADNLPAEDLRESELFKQIAYLEGASWLLLACAYVEEKKLDRLPKVHSLQPHAAATRLCQTHRPANLLEDDAQTVEFLRHYQPATLQVVLPYARAYRDLIEHVMEIQS
jgi:hypothetical protein